MLKIDREAIQNAVMEEAKSCIPIGTFFWL